MPTWTEFNDAITVQTARELHPQSLVEFELGEGVSLVFGEPKAKFRSGRYQLSEVIFDKPLWDIGAARQWWGIYDACVFKRGKYGLNRKLMPVDSWYEFGNGFFVFICRRGKKGDYTAMDYITGRVEVDTGDTEDSPARFCPGCGKAHTDRQVGSIDAALLTEAAQHVTPRAKALIRDIQSIPGQKIVTVIVFYGGQPWPNAFDIHSDGAVGYADNHKTLFEGAISLGFQTGAGIMIRQFLDFGVNEFHDGEEVYIPRKNLYGAVVESGQYRFLTAEEVESVSNQDAETGARLELEKYVFYSGFPPGEDADGIGTPWDTLEL